MLINNLNKGSKKKTPGHTVLMILFYVISADSFKNLYLSSLVHNFRKKQYVSKYLKKYLYLYRFLNFI